MVPFDLALTIENEQVLVTVEQLERFADADGYIRYDIRAADRRSVVYVDVVDQQPVNPAYNDPEIFTVEECKVFAEAILQYNREARVVFAQFLMDF